jgi:hypothetical protein
MLVEITELRLREGVSDDEFLAVDREVQHDVFPFHPGFARRTTARGDDGTWAVIVLWGSDEEAQAAAADVTSHPAAVRLAELADPASIRVRRYTTLD